MHLRSVTLLCIGLVCLVISAPGTADYPIEVIELKSRPLDEILPVIQPFAGNDGTVTGMGNNLIIKASPARVREIKRLLVNLDRPPRRLLITVGNQDDVARASSGYRASADINAGDSRVRINSPGLPVDSSRAQLVTRDSSIQRTQTSRSRVQALEGRPAFINSGSRIPLQTTERYYDRDNPYQRHTTQLQDVSSGLYVVPRLQGDEVTLEILQHNDRPGQRHGVIKTQGAGTIIRCRLGEWVELGGVNNASNNRQGGLGRSVNSQGSEGRAVQVKVECLDCAGRLLQDSEWK